MAWPHGGSIADVETRRSSWRPRPSTLPRSPRTTKKFAVGPRKGNAKPSCVRGTGGKGDIGILRLDFPGFTGEDKLEEIEWDEWFEKFDERGLALLYQEETAAGEKSNFNKIVSRETAEEAESKSHGKSASKKSSKSSSKKK